jgi:hypothetical protein
MISQRASGLAGSACRAIGSTCGIGGRIRNQPTNGNATAWRNFMPAIRWFGEPCQRASERYGPVAQGEQNSPSTSLFISGARLSPTVAPARRKNSSRCNAIAAAPADATTSESNIRDALIENGRIVNQR